MNKIIALTDYKNNFGSKWKSNPYRSGYDKDLLRSYFNKEGFDIEFISFSDVNFDESIWKNQLVIYTSSEEVGYNYKSFIEDIVLELERIGAILIPGFDFLRANNNKVYMEILRNRILGKELSGNKSKYYGTLDELFVDIKGGDIVYPLVIKTAAGAMSRGVFLAHNEKELIKYAKIISRTPNAKSEIKEIIRERKHKGYQRESKYQSKFITQAFVPNLNNDWKVLIYGDHYYILKRGIKGDDFRASGSHYNYKAGSKSEFPIHKLDEVKQMYEALNTPHLSLDYAFDGTRGYVHEIQGVYFGTSTLEFCDDYYYFNGNEWVVEGQTLDQEGEYVYSIIHFLKNHTELIKE
jgi:sporulation protein YlmC with PRC-barrel domain